MIDFEESLNNLIMVFKELARTETKNGEVTKVIFISPPPLKTAS